MVASYRVVILRYTENEGLDTLTLHLLKSKLSRLAKLILWVRFLSEWVLLTSGEDYGSTPDKGLPSKVSFRVDWKNRTLGNQLWSMIHQTKGSSTIKSSNSDGESFNSCLSMNSKEREGIKVIYNFLFSLLHEPHGSFAKQPFTNPFISNLSFPLWQGLYRIHPSSTDCRSIISAVLGNEAKCLLWDLATLSAA